MKSTIPVYPLADLPGAQAMTIWDAVETPEGGVIFSAVAEYGPRSVRPGILNARHTSRLLGVR